VDTEWEPHFREKVANVCQNIEVSGQPNRPHTGVGGLEPRRDTA